MPTVPNREEFDRQLMAEARDQSAAESQKRANALQAGSILLSCLGELPEGQLRVYFGGILLSDLQDAGLARDWPDVMPLLETAISAVEGRAQYESDIANEAQLTAEGLRSTQG
jgi:hypothetical protein